MNIHLVKFLFENLFHASSFVSIISLLFFFLSSAIVPIVDIIFISLIVCLCSVFVSIIFLTAHMIAVDLEFHLGRNEGKKEWR